MHRSEKYEISALKLWSPLQRYLANNGQSKATPQQWIDFIRSLPKKGISAVEIEWSLIIPALEKSSATLLSKNVVAGVLASQPSCALVLQRHITNDYEPIARWEKQKRPAKLFANWFANGRRESRILHFRERAFGLCIWLHEEIDPDFFRNHYTYWTLSVPGGKKGLVARKSVRTFDNLQDAKKYGQTLVTRMARRLSKAGFVGRPTSLTEYTEYALPGGENYTEWLITAPNLPIQYFGSHFDLPNIVAHVRTTERISQEGGRLLVLEEIQSDWNQALREAINDERMRQNTVVEGAELFGWYDDSDRPPNNPYRTHWLGAALRMMLLYAASLGVSGIAWLPGRIHVERYPRSNSRGLTVFYDRIVPSAVKKLAKSWGMQLSTAKIPTESRYYKVRKIPGAKKWRILDSRTSHFVGGEFTDRCKAEADRRAREEQIMENVPAILISNEVCADIRKHGLPYLGAIGTRTVSTKTE